MAAATTAAFAGGNTVDQSRDVYINHTILGNWSADATSVSNDKPNVDKSLAIFGKTVTGKNERVEGTTGKVSKTNVVSSVFPQLTQN